LKNLAIILSLFLELFWISPKQVIRITLASVFLGFMEVLSVTSLLPIIQVVTGEQGTNSSTILKFNEWVFVALGMEKSLANHILYFLGLSFLSSLVYMLVAYDRATFIRDRELSIKGDVLKAILYAKWDRLCFQHHGKLVNGLTRESDLSRTSYDFLLNCTTNLIFVLSLMATLFWLDPFLSLICLAVYASTYIVIGPVLNYSKKLGQDFAAESTHYSQSILNMCRSLKNVKAMSLESQIDTYVSDYVKKVARAYFLSNGIVSAFRNRFFEFLGMLSLCTLIFFAINIVNTDKAIMLLMLSVLIKMTPVASSTFNQVALVLGSYPSIQYVKSMMEELKTPLDKGQGNLLAPHIGHLTFQNVSFSYGDKPILTNFSKTFEKGKFYKVIGESGGGKTTLLDLCAGLLSPQDGQILVDGTSLVAYEKTSLSERIGYLSQNSFILEGSLKNNLLWGQRKEVSQERLLMAIEMAGLSEFVSEHGLDHPVTESGQNLSGGQKQRISLARLFLGDYDFLLLDEPTSALDRFTENHVMNHLRKMRGHVGIICITHRQLDQEGDFDDIINMGNHPECPA